MTRNDAPTPGDLYVLPASAEQGVEWLVVDPAATPEPGDAKRFLLVVADTRPEAGGDDIELFADEPAGPLVLRTAHALVVPSSLLEPRLRTRRVADDAVERVRERRRRAAEGDRETDWIAQETDASPSYRAWLDEVVRPAVEAVRAVSEPDTGPPGPGAPPGVPVTPPGATAEDDDTTASTVSRKVRPFRRRGGPSGLSGGYLLAAVLALAVIGLSLYVVQLRDALRRPVYVSFEEATEVDFETERALPERELTLDSSRVLLPILPQWVTGSDIRYRIVGPGGEELWAQTVDRPTRTGGILDLSPMEWPESGTVTLVLEVPDGTGGWREVPDVERVLRLAPETGATD